MVAISWVITTTIFWVSCLVSMEEDDDERRGKCVKGGSGFDSIGVCSIS